MISGPRFIDKSEVEAVVRLLDAAFDKTPARYFRRKLVEPDCQTIAIFDGEIPVATVTLYDRQVWYDGSRLKMLGIGDVGTHPDYRGKGLASKLMRFAVDYIREQGYPLSILFTDINRYYERFGYITIHRKFTVVKTGNGSVTGRIVRFESYREALPYVEKMLRLYEELAKTLDYPIFRTADYYRRALKCFFDDGGEGVAFFDGDDLTAYAFYRLGEDDMAVVFDFGGNVNSLVGSLPGEKALFTLKIEDLGGDLEPVNDTGMMVLWVSPELRKTDERPYFALIDGF